MSSEEIKATIDAAIGAKILLTYPQLFSFALLSGIFAYLGSYLKKKGENLATQEDIRVLTERVEGIKVTYSRQVEDYKAELARRTQAAKVAELLTEWLLAESDKNKLTLYSMDLSLWLPTNLYRTLAKRLCNNADAVSTQEVLIEVRKHLLKDEAGDLTPTDIVFFK